MRTTDRMTGAVVLTVAGACFVVLAWLLVPWSPVPGGAPDPIEASAIFTDDQVARAQHYAGWARVWSWSSLLVHLSVVTAFLAPRARRALEARLLGPQPLRVLIAVLLVLGAARILTLPLAAAAHQNRRNHDLTHQPWWAWGRDVAVSWLVAAFTTAVGVAVLVALVHRWRKAWPAVAAALAAATVVAGSWVYPVAVEPLFNSFDSLEEGELRAGVFDLARREGVELDDVLVADASRRTTTLNAYVSGFGGTRRVVLYDNLVEEVPQEQVLSVVAHELAHAAHRDVVVGTALGAVGAAAGVGVLPFLLRRRQVVALVTATLAAVEWGYVVTAPVENGISRAIEVRADVDALKATGDPVAFVEVQKMLALRALADPDPPGWAQWWWGSHPGVLERVALGAHGCCSGSSPDRRGNEVEEVSDGEAESGDGNDDDDGDESDHEGVLH